MQMSWALSCSESRAKGRLELSPLSTGLWSLVGNRHPWESVPAKDTVHHHSTDSRNGSKERPLLLCTSWWRKAAGGALEGGIYDPTVSPDASKYFDYYLAYQLTGHLQSLIRKSQPTVKVVYFSHPNLKHQKEKGERMTRGYATPVIGIELHSFLKDLCPAWVHLAVPPACKLGNPQVGLLLGPWPFSLSSLCSISTLPAL